MLVLAIDTTSEHGGVALYRDLDCLVSVHNSGSSGFSVTLFHMVDQALSEGGAKLSGQPIPLREVELFAAANGPGSFTGIRTGLAAVQGWATALARPVVGVSILAAMAEAAQPMTEWAAALMDARRDEFYFGLFRRNTTMGESCFSPAGEGMVLAGSQVLKYFDDRVTEGKQVTFLSRDNDPAAAAIHTALLHSTPCLTVPGFLVGTIAKMGLAAHQHG